MQPQRTHNNCELRCFLLHCLCVVDKRMTGEMPVFSFLRYDVIATAVCVPLFTLPLFLLGGVQ